MKRLFPTSWMADASEDPPEKQMRLSFLEQVQLEVENQGKIARNSNANQNFEKELSILEATGRRSQNLDKLFNAIMTSQATSTESERAFSTSNKFSTKFRSRLSDKHLDMIVFLKYYFKRANSN
jgi:hypothetical protein